MSHLFLGFLVIVVGFILFLNNFGLADVDLGHLIGTYWPLVLILWGIGQLTAPFRESSKHGVNGRKLSTADLMSGLVLVTIGSLLILRNIGAYSADLSFLWKLFWPVIIILVGISLLRGSNHHNIKGKNHVAIMGGIELGKTATWNLKSESYWAIMGGIELDLTKAMIPEGETVLDLTAVMGGVKVIVPADLAVYCEGSALLGGIDFLGEGSGGLISNKTMSSGVNEDKKTIVRIYVRAFMGGAEIKRFHSR